MEWKMRPISCGSPEEALLYFGNNTNTNNANPNNNTGMFNIDLALIDICMPKIDGNELARRIKIRNPTIPLVALSSFAIKPTN